MDSTYSEKTEIAVVRYIDKMTAVQSFESCVMKSISPVSLARSVFGKFKGIKPPKKLTTTVTEIFKCFGKSYFSK